MCGLEVTLGAETPPVPQAAHDWTNAILADLELADRTNKGKAKKIDAGGPGAEANTAQTRRKAMSEAGKGKASSRKRPRVDEESQSEEEIVEEENGQQGQPEGINDGDETIAMAIDVDEMQEVSPFHRPHFVAASFGWFKQLHFAACLLGTETPQHGAFQPNARTS